MNSKIHVALVTGASSGIGKALSYELVKRGWQVIGIARSGDKLAQIKDEVGSKFIPIVCDVSKKEEVRKCSQQILDMNLIPSVAVFA